MADNQLECLVIIIVIIFIMCSARRDDACMTATRSYTYVSFRKRDPGFRLLSDLPHSLKFGSAGPIDMG